MARRKSAHIFFLIPAFLATAFFASAVTALEMRVGTAKGNVTPDMTLKLTAGKLNDGTMLDTTGKEHDLFARALTLFDGNKRLVVVTYDSNSLDVATPILRERCLKELGIEPAYLLLLCTHNHQAPMPRWKENFPFQRLLAERIFGLIEEAIAAERGPATLLFGSGPGYFLRSGANAPVDYEVQLLQVMRGKETIALLFNQPTHPIHSSRTAIDVGHPGYAMDELEKLFPGALPLYGDACGGNQFPIAARDSSYSDLQRCKLLGARLARTVKDIASGPMVEVTGPISSRLETLSLPLAPPLPYEEALALAKNIPMEAGYDHQYHRSTNWIRALIRHYREGAPFPTHTGELFVRDEGYVFSTPEDNREFPCRFEEVIVARIGEMPLVALQGEVCAPIGMRIKDAFRCERPIMLFAYMGEHNIYIPTRESVRLNDYHAQVIQIQYASPVGWAPEVEDETVNGTIQLIREALGK